MTGTSTFIDAETMRHKRVRTYLGNDQWSAEHDFYDLRGTPVGDKAEVWEWDRLVYPGRRQQGRRAREYITAMYCPEGWWSTSGTADEPAAAICSTLLDAKWTAGKFPGNFNAFHAEHPVVWVVKAKRHTNVRVLRYCESELPDEYRPQLRLDGTP